MSAFVLGFSVLDADVARFGGVDQIDAEFRTRLARAHAKGLIPSGVVWLDHWGRMHEREQWVAQVNFPDMIEPLTDLVVAWEETEDVDTCVN